MRLRNTLILFGMAAALVLFIALFERRTKTTLQVKVLQKRAFPEFDGKTERADAIEIIRGAERIVLVKRGAGTSDEHWRITQPVDYRADTSRVIGFLGAFERAEKVAMGDGVFEKRLLPTDPVEPYRLDKAVHVIVSAGKERLLDCLVGGPTASKGKVYVSHASREAVYAVGDELRDEALRRVDEFRDKHLVNLTVGEVTGLQILEENEVKAELARKKGGRWHLVSPVADRADGGRVREIIDRLGSLWADRFVVDFAPDAPDRPDRMAGYGLLPAKRSVKVTVELAGEAKAHEILFGRKIEKTETNRAASWDVYAMVAGVSTVVLIPKASVDVLDVTVDELRDHNVVDFSADDVASVSVKRASGELRLEKKDGEWRLAARVTAPDSTSGALMRRAAPSGAGRSADKDSVRELLDALTELRVRRFLPAGTKLEAPVSVEVALERPADIYKEGEEAGDDERTRKRESELVLFEPAEGDVIRARRGKAGAVFEVSSSILERLEARPLHFYHRKVLEFDQARLAKLSITAEGRTSTAVRKGGEWKLEGEGEVDTSRADDIKWALSELKTPEFVAKVKGADLGSFGLEPPQVRVVATVKSERPGGKGSSHVLLVGRARKKDTDKKDAGKKYYARLEQGDEVFLVEEKLVKDLRAGLVK